MNTLLVIILVAVGVALLVVELFLIPGIGLAGIAGAASLVAGVICAYIFINATAGHVVLCSSVVLCAVAIYLFVRCRTLDKMALKENINSKVDLIDGTDIEVGNRGKTISRLAPMGKVRIGQIEIEAKSADVFIEDGVEVEVIALEGNKVIVRTI